MDASIVVFDTLSPQISDKIKRDVVLLAQQFNVHNSMYLIYG